MEEIVECISRQFQQVERIYADLYGTSVIHCVCMCGGGGVCYGISF